MNRKDISSLLENIQPAIEQIDNEASLKIVSTLLNATETLVAENDQLEDENQILKDEINRLKGEQGKPNIKANKKKDGDISSENERKKAEDLDEETSKREGFKLDKSALEKLKEQRLPIKLLEQLDRLKNCKYSDESEFIKEIEAATDIELTEQHRKLLIKYARYKKRNRQSKIAQITIDRQVECPVDTACLPTDIQCKGYQYKVVQDVIIKTDNVEFKREVYYSPSQAKSYLGAVPKGYDKGDFGPHINADIVSMKYVNGMSIPKIVEFYRNIGTLISGSYISNRLTDPSSMNVFHEEKDNMHQSAIENSPYVQIDDTGTRVNGQNYYTQILCNDFYTAFFTTKRKNRLTVLDVLRNFESRHFLLNDKTLLWLKQVNLAKKDRQLLSDYKCETLYQEDEMLDILQTLYGTGSPRKRTKIMEGCAINAYRQETGIAVVKILVSDDAPQFKLLTDELALCWIHEARHYKRLNPVVTIHQQKLEKFLGAFWQYYRKLALYKINPNDEQAKVLSTAFDQLFSTTTDYDDLDERIKKSKQKKTELLVVLKHPEVPLHNNASENGARVEKRRRDVSLQTKSVEGTKSKDTMMSIVETCKKLGISAYQFIHDRVNGINQFPPLADLIRAKARGQPVVESTE